jgi:hypothetical protein
MPEFAGLVAWACHEPNRRAEGLQGRNSAFGAREAGRLGNPHGRPALINDEILEYRENRIAKLPQIKCRCEAMHLHRGDLGLHK